ncbi:hypothetical protein EMCRGX_G026299 [Ephydatia muelleri]
MQQSTDDPSVGDAAEPQAVTIISEVAPQAAESRPLQPANSATPAATCICISRKREVLLFDASLFPSLTAELSAMKKYFEEPLSTSRRGAHLAESTVATTERRILTFLGFAKLHAGASNPELRLVSDLELVKRFFHYLENERQSSSGNQFAYCLSFLRAMRYLKSDSDTIKTVQQWCRTYQKAYERKDRSWQRLEAEGKWLAWDAVLEVLKQQRELYESSGPCELTRAQESQKYTVLLLYCSIPPARSKEYRELRVTFSRQNLATWDPVSNAASNWLVVQNDHSRALLYLGAHKTSRKTGPNRIQLNSTDSTKVVLDQLVHGFCMSGQRRLTERQRPSRHNRLAVSGNLNLHACMLRGEPFGTSDSWTKYIQSIFKQLANVAISSNALRSSFVTDLLTSRNRPSDDLLAEVAFAMRHSSREQSRTYDRRSSADKVTRAVALTSERVATALDVTTAAAPAPVATTTSSKRRRRADDDDDDNVAPEVGDIVGAVDDSSTLRKPFVHFVIV